MLALLRVLGAVGVVVILAVLVVVVVGVLALRLALGVALSLAVAVVVVASLWMSGHRGKLLEWDVNLRGELSITVAQGAANAETAGVRGAVVPQTMGIRSGRVELLVVVLPRNTVDVGALGADGVVERVCCCGSGSLFIAGAAMSQ